MHVSFTGIDPTCVKTTIYYITVINKKEIIEKERPGWASLATFIFFSLYWSAIESIDRRPPIWSIKEGVLKEMKLNYVETMQRQASYDLLLNCWLIIHHLRP